MSERTQDMAASAALKAAKKELRTLMKKKLSAIPQESINAQSLTVCRKLTALEPYQSAQRIGVYLSMPSGEVQTDAIVRHALQAEKQIFVPYLYKTVNPPPNTPRSVMDMVHLRSLKEYEMLERDNWGIPTINAESVAERQPILGENGKLDLILMPGVAFSQGPKVKRLGHGKGFYDYFLHRYMQLHGSEGPGTDVLLYGLALEEQLVADVPVGEHDHFMHGLLVGGAE